MFASRIALSAALALTLGVASAHAGSVEISMGAPAQDKTVNFQVFFKLTNTGKLAQFLEDVQNPTKSAVYHHFLTPAQFKAAYGPDPKAVDSVRAALTAAGMTVTHEGAQKIDVVGSVAQVEKMFSTHLTTMRSVETGRERQVIAEGRPVLPEVMAKAGATPVNFESRIITQVQSHKIALPEGAVPAARLNTGPVQGYFFNDMRAAYSFPDFTTVSAGTGLATPMPVDGQGTVIGILISSVAENTDLALQFNSTITLKAGGTIVQNYSGNTNLAVPAFNIQEVSGGSGPFGNGAADEASLDTQASLGTAPGASEILFDIPDLSDGSILSGIDTIDEFNNVDVVSQSFGGCEFLEITNNPFTGFLGEGFTLQAEDQLYQQGSAQGITFLASSGDEGGLPCTNDLSATGYIAAGGVSPDAPGVEDPAADPNVTAVGGTNLATTSTATAQDTYVEENAFGDPLIPVFDQFGLGMGGESGAYWGSGGGVSQFFAKPSYQNLVSTRNATQRTTPDISMMMGGCPGGITGNPTFCNTQERSFALVFIGGQLFGLIGTSVSSPQFAGVVADMIELNGGGSALNTPPAGQANAPKGRLGNINTLLYTLSAQQATAGGPIAPANMQFFNRRIQGFNGFWGSDTILQYSYVLGVGTPIVTNLLGLQGAALAGNPGTPSNP